MISFKIKTEYCLNCLKLLALETMNFVGSIKSKISKKGWLQCASFRMHWSSISQMWYCQQWLSIEFKSLVYICS